MARAIRQRMPRVAESFGGCSAEAGGTRGRVTCQERGQWAPGGWLPGPASVLSVFSPGNGVGHGSLCLMLAP